MADDYGSAPRNVPTKRHGTGRDARCADRLQPANGRRPDAPCPVRASTMEPGSMAIDDAAFPLNPLGKRMRVSRADQAASQHRANARRRAIFPYGNIHPRIQISAPHPSILRAGAYVLRSHGCEKPPVSSGFSVDLEARKTPLDRDRKNAHTVSETRRSRVRYFQRARKRDCATRTTADMRAHEKSPGLRRGFRRSSNALPNVIAARQNVMLQLSMRPVSALALSLTRSRQLPLIGSDDRSTL
jgi:hypothetical protein